MFDSPEFRQRREKNQSRKSPNKKSPRPERPLKPGNET